MKIDVTKLSKPRLSSLIEQATAELKRRRIIELTEKPCMCDRYTCVRCQELNRLER